MGKAAGTVSKLLPEPMRGPLGLGLAAISIAAALVAGLLGVFYLRRRSPRRRPRDQATRIRR